MTHSETDQTEDAEDGGSSGTVRAAWDGSGPPSTAVVEAVAAAEGRDPMEMPSLYDAIDVEALDGLLTSDRTEARGNVAVSFTYDGAFVWVDSGGAIEIDPGAASAE